MNAFPQVIGYAPGREPFRCWHGLMIQVVLGEYAGMLTWVPKYA